jgi:hypothetical protein
VRYADCDALRLDQIIVRHGKSEEAIKRRDGSEVTLEAIVRMFGPKVAPPRQPRRAPAVQPVNRPRPKAPESPVAPLSAHDGRPLRVTKWVPGMKKAPAV